MRYSDLLGGVEVKAPVVIQADPTAESVEIPNGTFLLTAEYSQVGADLVLDGPKGPPVVVEGYFGSETPPLLTNGEGAEVWPELVRSLAGPMAPAQVAQASGGAAGTEIGQVTELAGDVRVVRANGVEEPLDLDDRVYQGDVLITTPGSSVGLTFIDNTLFSLAGEGRLVLDQVIFNPDGVDNELSLSLVHGAFAFVSGQIAGADGPGMSIRTPVATVGVRGTTGGGVVGDAPATGEFQAVFALLESLLGNLGVVDVQVANAVLTLAVALATAGITADGAVVPTDFTPALQAALSDAIVSLRTSLARLIQEIEPGFGGDDVLPGQGDADPGVDTFFSAEELQAFGEQFGGSPIGDVAQLLGLLNELLAFIGPVTDPSLPLLNQGGGIPELEASSLAVNINMIVTFDGTVLFPGFLQALEAEASPQDGYAWGSLNMAPYIGFVGSLADLGNPDILFELTSLPDAGELVGNTLFFSQFFKYDPPGFFNFVEVSEDGVLYTTSFTYQVTLDGESAEGQVDIQARDPYFFGTWVEAEWGYVTTGTEGTDIIYANPFIGNFWSMQEEWEGPFVQILEGQGGNDALVGTDGFDGYDGDDYMYLAEEYEFEVYEDLRGGPGDDLLLGLGGNDILNGGTGNDWLLGDWPGSYGTDTFVYNLNEDSGDDHILDIDGGEFAVGFDTLELQNVAEDFDSLLELDSQAALDAGFSVVDDGTDVTVTFGQGGGSVVLHGQGVSGNLIDSFTDLSQAVDLVVNGDQLLPQP